MQLGCQPSSRTSVLTWDLGAERNSGLERPRVANLPSHVLAPGLLTGHSVPVLERRQRLRQSSPLKLFRLIIRTIYKNRDIVSLPAGQGLGRRPQPHPGARAFQAEDCMQSSAGLRQGLHQIGLRIFCSSNMLRLMMLKSQALA